MLGIDVSTHQKRIDWMKVAAARQVTWPGGEARDCVSFALIKTGGAEIGRCFTDGQFVANWRAAKAAGIRRGAYWFMHGSLPDAGGRAQATHFLAAIDAAGGMAEGDLLPVVDVEWPKEGGHLFILDELAEFVAVIEDQARATPILYTGAWYWKPIKGDKSAFARCPLWFAAYTKVAPPVPDPWSRWDLWQFTDRGRVDGVSGPVDLNRLAPHTAIEELCL